MNLMEKLILLYHDTLPQGSGTGEAVAQTMTPVQQLGIVLGIIAIGALLFYWLSKSVNKK